MQTTIHPEYTPTTFECTCGHAHQTLSTLQDDKVSVEVCSSCHPFYTGSNRLIDTAGRVEKFNRKYARK